MLLFKTQFTIVILIIICTLIGVFLINTKKSYYNKFTYAMYHFATVIFVVGGILYIYVRNYLI